MSSTFRNSLLLLISLCCLWSSCQSQNASSASIGATNTSMVEGKHIKKQTYYPNQKPKEVYFVNQSGQKDSLYQLWDHQGNLQLQGYYVKDNKHGQWENFQRKLTHQGETKHEYYEMGTLTRELYQVWKSLDKKVLQQEEEKLYEADSVIHIIKQWDEAHLLSSQRITYFDKNNLDQANGQVFHQSWYPNSSQVKSEGLLYKARPKWKQSYTINGQLKKRKDYNAEGDLAKLTLYGEENVVKATYTIAKVEMVEDAKKGTVEFVYYDEKGKALPNELFE